MRYSNAFPLLLLVLAAGCSDGIERAAAVIDEDLLRKDVTILAGDQMEGRAPGSYGDKLARKYLARRLGDMGCTAAAKGGVWEQPFDIVGILSHMPEAWSFHNADGRGISLSFGEEYMGSSGDQRENVVIEDAEVVFVGYGIEAPEENWNDFKGADLRGKVLLMLNDDPHWDPEMFAGERKLYYGRWNYKYESAARQGAAAAIIIHTTPSAGYPWAVVRSSGIGEQFELPAGAEPRVAVQAWITEESARALTALGGRALDDLVESAGRRDFHPVPLGVDTSISFSTEIRRTQTANVIGLMAGADPELSGEVVIFSAHHDHFGIGEPDDSGDDIYNGARDNGIAMAQALAVGEAFAALPERPRRSVMFLFVAAEEQGLLGSQYYAAHPTFHPGRIAADINFELGNIWGRTRDVTIFGMGKSTIEELLAEAASLQGRTVGPEKDVRAGWYYRSDQFSFARIGVPSIWFHSGTDYIGRPEGWGEKTLAEWIERDYHRPSDEVRDDWNYEGVIEDAQLAFRLGLAVANADSMPSWYAGDEFESVRKKAVVDAEAGTPY